VRNLLAAPFAIPVVVSIYVRTFFSRSVVSRSGLAQVVSVGVVALLIVGGLLFAFPGKSSAYPAPQFDPRTPTAVPADMASDMPLSEPVQIQFSKAMDGASVASNINLQPAELFDLKWDASGRILTLLPRPFWSADTYYTVRIGSGARDRNGLPLGEEVRTDFLTGPYTSGAITATEMVGKEISPTTSFQISFTRAVKLETVISRFGITPVVQGTIEGDDPTDTASQVFTFKPSEALDTGMSYTASFFDTLAVDASGVPVRSVTSLTASTVSGPAVVRFRPRNKSTDAPLDKPVSVRFTTAMDTASTAAAFSVTVNGKAVEGKIEWAERNTVLVFTPKSTFPFGAKVVAKVGDTALGANGMKIQSAATASFKVVKPIVRPIVGGKGAVVIGTSPWKTAEYYTLSLINCTRTGGWVISSGACSSYTHHTMPKQPALKMDAGIAAKVARPFAKLMAEHNVLNHYYDGSPHYRFQRAGYMSGSWGENIGAPRSLTGGLVYEEMYFQNEYPCKCEHYYNIMSPYFDRVGVGIWVYSGRIRMASDFYRP
jgi:hypothetical protein